MSDQTENVVISQQPNLVDGKEFFQQQDQKDPLLALAYALQTTSEFAFEKGKPAKTEWLSDQLSNIPLVDVVEIVKGEQPELPVYLIVTDQGAMKPINFLNFQNPERVTVHSAKIDGVSGGSAWQVSGEAMGNILQSSQGTIGCMQIDQGLFLTPDNAQQNTISTRLHSVAKHLFDFD